MFGDHLISQLRLKGSSVSLLGLDTDKGQKRGNKYESPVTALVTSGFLCYKKMKPIPYDIQGRSVPVHFALLCFAFALFIAKLSRKIFLPGRGEKTQLVKKKTDPYCNLTIFRQV